MALLRGLPWLVQPMDENSKLTSILMWVEITTKTIRTRRHGLRQTSS